MAPGSQTGVFRGRLVIIKGTGPPGSGLFVYDAAGVLIGSIAATNGTGPLGGTVKKTITAYQDNAGAQGVYASLDQGALMAASLNPATTITTAGVVEVGDAVTAAAQPNMGMFSPATSALGQAQIVCWAESQDASKGAFNELLGKQTLIHVSGVPAFVTSALLEVQGQIDITGGHILEWNGATSGTNSIGIDDVTAVLRVLHDFAIDGNLYGTAGQLTIGETLTVFNNNIEVSGTTDLDGSLDVAGLATVNAQLNVLTLPINIQSMAQPTTPGSGVKLWSDASGHLQTVAGDGNAYDTERLLLEATGQLVNSAVFAPVTGWGGIALAVGTYHIRGALLITPNVAGGAIELKMTASGGLASPTFDLLTLEFTFPVGGGTWTPGSAGIIGLGGTFTSSSVGGGLGTRWITFDGRALVTVAGTLTPQVATTVGADNFNVDTSSYIEILPIVE